MPSRPTRRKKFDLNSFLRRYGHGLTLGTVLTVSVWGARTLGQIETKIDNHATNLSNILAKIDKIADDVKGVDSKLSDIRERISNLEGKLAKLQTETPIPPGISPFTQPNISKYQQEIDKLKKENNFLKNQVSELRQPASPPKDIQPGDFSGFNSPVLSRENTLTQLVNIQGNLKELNTYIDNNQSTIPSEQYREVRERVQYLNNQVNEWLRQIKAG